MTVEEKQSIDEILADPHEANLHRLKEIGSRLGAPAPSGCFCKIAVMQQYLNQFKSWYEQYLKDNDQTPL